MNEESKIILRSELFKLAKESDTFQEMLDELEGHARDAWNEYVDRHGGASDVYREHHPDYPRC
jgi:hypothetical protein